MRHSGTSGEEEKGVREDAVSVSGGEVVPFLKPAATSWGGWEGEWEEDGTCRTALNGVEVGFWHARILLKLSKHTLPSKTYIVLFPAT